METKVVSPVQGTVRFHFKPGISIKQGDLLAEMLSEVDAQKISAAKSRLDIAQQDVERAQSSSSPSAEDRKRLTQAEEELKKAREALDAAKRTVKYIKILAPCSGKLGTYLALQSDDELHITAGVFLLSIISYDSIYAVFDVDEQTVIQLRRRMADRLPDWELSRTVLCGLAGDNDFPLRGKVAAVDNEIDSKTGTQHWRVLLPNKDGVLMPGMFLRVRLAVSDPYKALLVPETSLTNDQGQRFVLVVNDQNVVQRRNVEVGQRQDDGLRVVTKGLTADDWVITAGLIVAPGTTVKPEKITTPSN